MPFKDPAKRRQHERQRLANIQANDPERWAAYTQRRREQGRAQKAKDKAGNAEAFRVWYWERGGKELIAARRNGKPETLRKARENDLRRTFGLTLEDYERLLRSQNGVCWICQRGDAKRALSVDHCHKTGKVRGLLCGKCNRAIGFIDDSLALLERAVTYLKLHAGTEQLDGG